MFRTKGQDPFTCELFVRGRESSRYEFLSVPGLYMVLGQDELVPAKHRDKLKSLDGKFQACIQFLPGRKTKNLKARAGRIFSRTGSISLYRAISVCPGRSFVKPKNSTIRVLNNWALMVDL